MNKNIAIFVATGAALALFGTGCVTAGYDAVYTTVPYAEEPVYVPTTYGQPTYIETVSPAYIHTTVIDVEPPPPRYHGYSGRHHHSAPHMERPHAHHHSHPETGSRPPASRPTHLRPASSRPATARSANSRSGGLRSTVSQKPVRAPAASRARPAPAKNGVSRSRGGDRPRSGGGGKTSPARSRSR